QRRAHAGADPATRGRRGRHRPAARRIQGSAMTMLQAIHTSVSRKARLLAAALIAFAATPLLAVEPFTADYQANYMGMQANGRMTLAREAGNRWKYSLDISGAGARLTQSTVFEADGDDWRPLSSVDTQRGESGLAAMLV